MADHRGEIVDQLADATGLLVGIDFDGTLAPIAADPDEPTITTACQQAIERLAAHPDTRVAVISGRELADLRGRVGLDGIVYAGNHGLELDRGSGTDEQLDAARHRQTLRTVLADLGDRLTEIPGVEIEDKGLTATVHVRQTPDERVDEVEDAVTTAVERADSELRIEPGKQVFELRPPVDWDKGSAIRSLSNEMPTGWRAVYLGDDVTDDDAFREVRPDGVGVLVGSRADAEADYRLPTQADVAPFLHWLVDGLLDEQPEIRS